MLQEDEATSAEPAKGLRISCLFCRFVGKRDE